MAEVQGVEEIDRILEIPNIIRRMGEAWEMSENEINGVCHRIEDIVEGLQAELQDMGMGFWQ